MDQRAKFGKSTFAYGQSFQQWQQSRAARERAARNRDKQKAEWLPKPVTMKARAIMFLTTILADGPLPVAEIMRRAVLMGLQPKRDTKPSPALRGARIALGIDRRKAGFDCGWIWALPVDDAARQVIDILEGDLSAFARMKKPGQPIDPAEGDLSRSHIREEGTASPHHEGHALRPDRWLPDQQVEAPCATTGAASVDASTKEQVEGWTVPLEPADVYAWRIGDPVGTVPIRFRHRRRDHDDVPQLAVAYRLEDMMRFTEARA